MRTDPKPGADAKSARAGGALPAAAFPVKVEAIVAFVMNPMDAYAAINAHVIHGDDATREQLNEGVNFSFSYGGIKHDVTLTREEPV